MQRFTLHSFSDDSDFAISGNISRQRQLLNLQFDCQGGLNQLLIPQPNREASRCDDLWQSTCFECFVRCPQQNVYWEYNFSPSGDWNIYQFDDYRQGMRTAELSNPQLAWQHNAQSAQFNIRCPLPDAGPLLVAICAVLQPMQGEHSYWALRHQGQQPDFHHPSGFIIEL